MNATLATSNLSECAKTRMLRLRGEPFLFAGWHGAVFLHFAVKPEELQLFVPFALDVFDDGLAYVSCVAFTMRGLRPRAGGAWLMKPIATHEFLNVRTYVRHGAERGIYFLAEWLPNKLAVTLGPALFGLPYRLGANRYHHEDAEQVSGEVIDKASGKALRYIAEKATALRTCDQGTREEFLLERYTAFTEFHGLKRCFHVWHPPWNFSELDAQVADVSLLDCTGSWAAHASLVAAHCAAGFDRVWMGRPRLIL